MTDEEKEGYARDMANMTMLLDGVPSFEVLDDVLICLSTVMEGNPDYLGSHNQYFTQCLGFIEVVSNRFKKYDEVKEKRVYKPNQEPTPQEKKYFSDCITEMEVEVNDMSAKNILRGAIENMSNAIDKEVKKKKDRKCKEYWNKKKWLSKDNEMLVTKCLLALAVVFRRLETFPI